MFKFFFTLYTERYIWTNYPIYRDITQFHLHPPLPLLLHFYTTLISFIKIKKIGMTLTFALYTVEHHGFMPSSVKFGSLRWLSLFYRVMVSSLFTGRFRRFLATFLPNIHDVGKWLTPVFHWAEVVSMSAPLHWGEEMIDYIAHLAVSEKIKRNYFT